MAMSTCTAIKGFIFLPWSAEVWIGSLSGFYHLENMCGVGFGGVARGFNVDVLD